MSVEQIAAIYSDVNSFDQTSYSKRTSTLQSGDEHLRLVTITQPTEKQLDKEIDSPSDKPGADTKSEPA
jgi:hypothetical protein